MNFTLCLSAPCHRGRAVCRNCLEELSVSCQRLHSWIWCFVQKYWIYHVSKVTHPSWNIWSPEEGVWLPNLLVSGEADVAGVGRSQHVEKCENFTKLFFTLQILFIILSQKAYKSFKISSHIFQLYTWGVYFRRGSNHFCLRWVDFKILGYKIHFNVCFTLLHNQI